MLWCILIFSQTSGLIVMFVEWSKNEHLVTLQLTIFSVMCMFDIVYFTVLLFIAAKIVTSLEDEKQILQRQLSSKAITNPSITWLVIDSIDFKLTGKQFFSCVHVLIDDLKDGEFI